MQSLIQFKRTTLLFFIPLALACFGLLPQTQGVIPAPDGAYGPPTYGQGNTAEGDSALFMLTTGIFNTAVGYQALYNNTTSNSNTAIGYQALYNNTMGHANTAIGTQALFRDTKGGDNTATGWGALGNNTMGGLNTAYGYLALTSNTLGGDNTAIGLEALQDNTIGNFNTAAGFQALLHNTGFHNIALGDSAGDNLTTGSHNIDIGNEGVAAESMVIRIGTEGTQDAAYIAGIFSEAVGPNHLPVLIDSTGKLGTTVMSSRQFKREIKPMEKISETILALKPVTFQYKSDKTNTPQFGLIAEEVAQVNPDLVGRNAKGEVNSVRYDAVNAMLLNEFLKEHKKVEEQQASISQLKSEMQSMVAQLKAQAVQIQKVSAQLEVSKPAPQMVLNKR